LRRIAKGKPVNIPAPGCGFFAATQLNAETTAAPTEQEKFKLGFKHYQRVEGVLTLQEGMTAKLVQARVLEKGQIRAQLSTNL